MIDVFKLIEDNGLTLHGDIEHFADLVRADEREECAKVVEADPSYDWHRFACEAAAAIRARLEQPEERYTYGTPLLDAFTKPAPMQEPVTVPVFLRKRLEREIESAIHPKGMSVHDGRTRAMANDIAYLLKVIDRYTTPPAARQWVGLTDEEKRSVCRVGPVYAPDGVVTRTPLQYRKELEGVALMAVRQAEAKLKEKNT